jgi:hypothetical protein
VSRINRQTILKNALASVGVAGGIAGTSNLVEAKSNRDYVVRAAKEEHLKEIQSYSAFKNSVKKIQEENESLNIDDSKLLVSKESLVAGEGPSNVEYRVSIPYASVDEFEPTTSDQALHVEFTGVNVNYMFKLDNELYLASEQKRGVFVTQGPLQIPGFDVKRVDESELCDAWKLPFEDTICLAAAGGTLIAGLRGADPTRILGLLALSCVTKSEVCNRYPGVIEDFFGDDPGAICDSDEYFVYKSGDILTDLNGFPIIVFTPVCTI